MCKTSGQYTKMKLNEIKYYLIRKFIQRSFSRNFICGRYRGLTTLLIVYLKNVVLMVSFPH
jgi:hypothetical protein